VYFEVPSKLVNCILLVRSRSHIIIIINEKINVAFSPKTARTSTHTKRRHVPMFGRQRKKQEGQQRHQFEVTNKYVFKCRLKVDSDDDDVTNDGKLLHARYAGIGISVFQYFEHV